MSRAGWSSPIVVSLALLAMAGYGALRPPWPLRVLQNDLTLALGASPPLLVALRLTATAVLLVTWLGFGVLLSRVFQKNWIGQVVAFFLLVGALATYLPAKNAFVARHWARAVSNGGTLVVVKRSAYLPEGKRVSALVLTTSLERVGNLPRSDWPFSFISEDAQAIQISREEIGELVETLRRKRFFALPEQLALGPALKPEGHYIALIDGDQSLRVFGRPGEPGFDFILEASEALELGVERDSMLRGGV